MHDKVLDALLDPITPQEFVHRYWGREPLFVKGYPDKFKGLFDGETFQRALALPGPHPTEFLSASFDTKSSTGESVRPATPEDAISASFRATSEQAVPLFKAGATLCATQIELRVPSLVPFISAIKRQLAYPGKVCFNAYLSPSGSGFNWHFDGRVASTLQIEGTKRWRYSRHPAIAWPRGNGALYADGSARYTHLVAHEWEQLATFDPAEVTEVTLEPGDLLVLPAGIWHEACGGSGGSLALNLNFTPLSYTTIVQQLLDRTLGSVASWRGPAPLMPLTGGVVGELDPVGVAAIRAELLRAATTLQDMAGDSASIIRLWQSLVLNPNPGAVAAFSPPASVTPVQPEQRLRVRDRGQVVAMLADGGSRLFTGTGTNRSFETSGDAMHFVQRILSENEFVASDCAGWSSNGEPFALCDVQSMLTSLASEGLLETA